MYFIGEVEIQCGHFNLRVNIYVTFQLSYSYSFIFIKKALLLYFYDIIFGHLKMFIAKLLNDSLIRLISLVKAQNSERALWSSNDIQTSRHHVVFFMWYKLLYTVLKFSTSLEQNMLQSFLIYTHL